VNGDFDDLHIEPYPANALTVILPATIVNSGEIASDYVVTVTDCPSHIAPVIAQTIHIDVGPQHAQTLEFNLRTVLPLTGEETCVASLRSPTGRLFQLRTVDFPPPTK
jgi:hypothetical protein